VIVESGGRPRGKGRKSALSFGRSKEKDEPEALAPSENKEDQKKKSKTKKKKKKNSELEVSVKEEEAAPIEEEQWEPVQVDEPVPEVEPVVSEHSSFEPASHPADVTQTVNASGRLFGWLVSYSEADGKAIELREGKFFVTRSSLKGSDLIIEDESVSTPHAMVSISVESGLQVQNLMSERGVFIRVQGADTYKREEDVIVVKNGDWVRFGDVEFLVSLIPYVGVE